MNKIAIFSVPRSGSTWLGQILNSHPNVVYKFQPNFAYSFPYSLSENSRSDEIDIFFKELLRSDDDFVNGKVSISSKKIFQFEKEEMTTLVFKETHFINTIVNLLNNSDVKIVGLVRSPFAVINSWRKLPKEFNSSWDIQEEWRFAQKKNIVSPFNFFGYEKWLETTLLFLELSERYCDRFYLINYEELISNSLSRTKEIFKFCELALTPQTINFISYSRSKNETDHYSFLRDKNNDNSWKIELEENIIQEIMKDKRFQEINKKFNWV